MQIEREKLRRLLLAVACVIAVVLVVRAVRKEEGVIIRNRIFAERLVCGVDPYHDGLHAPYPLAWGMFHASLSWMPLPVERAVWALGQVGALILISWICLAMLRSRYPPLADRWEWVVVLALIFTSRYWIRDTAGGGGNSILLAMGLAGIYLHSRRQTIGGAALVGLACALKLTSLLFLPYFLWRRQWRMAVWSGVFAALLMLSPALVTGWERYCEISWRWGMGVLGFLGEQDLGGAGPKFVPFEWMNQSLRNALFRFCTEIEHPHPFYVTFLRLDPATATAVARAIQAALLLGCALVMRRAAPGRQLASDPARMLAEVAMVYLLMLLLSPITWRAHHIAELPAAFLLITQVMSTRDESRRHLAGLLVVAFLLGSGMSQELWGKSMKDLLQAYYTVTFSCLLLVAGLSWWMWRHPSGTRQEEIKSSPPDP